MRLLLSLLLLLLAGCGGSSTEAEDVTGDRGGQHGAGGDWPLFRGNSTLTGVAASELPDQPALLWSYQAGADIESTAAIAEGKVFVGSLDGFLHAIDLETGTAAWTDRISAGVIRAVYGLRRSLRHALGNPAQKSRVWLILLLCLCSS